jgi:hypothetical protein
VNPSNDLPVFSTLGETFLIRLTSSSTFVFRTRMPSSAPPVPTSNSIRIFVVSLTPYPPADRTAATNA